jgi:hypothetical protein
LKTASNVFGFACLPGSFFVRWAKVRLSNCSGSVFFFPRRDFQNLTLTPAKAPAKNGGQPEHILGNVLRF